MCPRSCGGSRAGAEILACSQKPLCRNQPRGAPERSIPARIGSACGKRQRGERGRGCGHAGARRGHSDKAALAFEQDFSQTGDEKPRLRVEVPASVWGPGALPAAPAQGKGRWRDVWSANSKSHRLDPKTTSQTSVWSCLTARAPTPAGGGQSPSGGPVGLPSPQRPGHPSGKGTGTPFPASTAAVPASFASDPPNYG